MESGHLNIGIPCVPAEIQRQFKGKVKVIQAHSCKFSLVDIRKHLLNKHQHLMRLHSNDEMATMTRERILELLHLVNGSEHTDYSTDELREILTHNERSRSLWVWHDHSSLVSHGIIAVMIGIMYDPIVFLSESESPSIQEFVEEGEIHFVVHGTSSLSDQLAIVPERVAELEGLSEPVRTENGIQVVDILRFFKGDRPAAEFESGISCYYPLVSHGIIAVMIGIIYD